MILKINVIKKVGKTLIPRNKITKFPNKTNIIYAIWDFPNKGAHWKSWSNMVLRRDIDEIFLNTFAQMKIIAL